MIGGSSNKRNIPIWVYGALTLNLNLCYLCSSRPLENRIRTFINVAPSLSPSFVGSLYGRKLSRTKPCPNSKRKIVKTKRKLVDAVPIPVMPTGRQARSKYKQIMNRLQMRNESRQGVKNVAENSTTARGLRPVQERRRFQREVVDGLRHADPWH
jgi:hypothetical protein